MGHHISVHPRACGEHIRPGFLGTPQGGSSPRLRGTLVGPAERRIGPRFIPAPAGNTRWSMPRSGRLPVHPRACGEHPPIVRHLIVEDGSSPRLRGTPPHWRGRVTEARFIPAPAGNTCRVWCPGAADPVHPRACGEHYFAFFFSAVATGSSPRLRGTPPREALGRLAERFIPAPAGNTTSSSCSPPLAPVHPRACGEHRQLANENGWQIGSSPRLRGTLFPEPIEKARRFGCQRFHQLFDARWSHNSYHAMNALKSKKPPLHPAVKPP